MMTAAPAVLTLSFGGVSFCLTPKEDHAKVAFQGQGEDIVLQLEGFTGSLKVTSLATSSPPKPSISKVEENPSSPESCKMDEEPERSPGQQKLPFKATKRASNEMSQSKRGKSSSNARATKRTRALADNEEQPPQLAQQLASSSMSAFSPPDNDDFETPEQVQDSPHLATAAEYEVKEPSPSIQEMLERASSQDSNCDDSVVTNGDDAFVSDNISVANNSPLVETSRGDPPPCPRWGHTLSKIDHRLVVYGGQTMDGRTLSDLHIYDTRKGTWYEPLNCHGMSRQWHTATYLPKKQLLVTIGGESVNPKTGKTKTTDQVMVLDTDIMLWYPLAVSGNIPSGRSGHTASVLSTDELVIFGGVKGSKWLNSVSVLDTNCWKWSVPKIQGVAPKSRSYASATAIARENKDMIVIFGGNGATASFNTVHVLEQQDKQWRWINPDVSGTKPMPRTGHTAILLEDNKTICIYGGWDPNSEGSEDAIFQDCFLLDTENWTWRHGPSSLLGLSGAGASDTKDESRVGHSMVLLNGNQVALFGGRRSEDQFAGDLHMLSAPQLV